MILNGHDRSDWVSSVRKTRQDNDMTNRTDVVKVENKTELLCLIGSGAVYDKNQIGHRCD